MHTMVTAHMKSTYRIQSIHTQCIGNLIRAVCSLYKIANFQLILFLRNICNVNSWYDVMRIDSAQLNSRFEISWEYRNKGV